MLRWGQGTRNTFNMSKTRPLGGRGKKPGWDSLVLRYPAPLKPILLGLIDRFHLLASDTDGVPILRADEENLNRSWEILCQKEKEIYPQPAPAVEILLPTTTTTTSAIAATLTPDQESALVKLQQFITSNDRCFRLTGYAGTGKSFLIAQLMKWLIEKKLDFVAASPTNKAAKSLSRLAKAAGISAECTTIAKLLGQQPQLDSTGTEVFVADTRRKRPTYSVVLLDEFSMISSNNYQEITKGVTGKSKIIYIGDVAQLPPVGETESVVASILMPSATLTTIVRYDGEIGKVAEEIRSDRRYNSHVYPFTTTSDETIVCLPRLGSLGWLEMAGKLFQSQQCRDNPDFCRFIVWRNNTAGKLNFWVRQVLWGAGCADFVVGDRLIAKKPVFREMIFTRKKKKKEWMIAMNNSEECEVVETPTLNNDSDRGWQYWSIPVKTEDGDKLELNILVEASEKQRQAEIKNLKEFRDYQAAADLDKLYDSCPYSYAITTHKAQGSGISYIFLDIQDMRGCPDLQKLQYTALTRAKYRAYIPR